MAQFQIMKTKGNALKTHQNILRLPQNLMSLWAFDLTLFEPVSGGICEYFLHIISTSLSQNTNHSDDYKVKMKYKKCCTVLKVHRSLIFFWQKSKDYETDKLQRKCSKFWLWMWLKCKGFPISLDYPNSLPANKICHLYLITIFPFL